MNFIAPDAVEKFRVKAQDHSGAPHFLLLGSKGQFAEINKKFWKLYNAIWQDRQLIGEQPYEIVQDLIGHCLLMLFCLEQEGHRDAQLDLQPMPDLTEGKLFPHGWAGRD